MAKVIVIGGIESTFRNAQVLHDLGEEIVQFYTRGEDSPGWEGVAMIDPDKYPFYSKIPVTQVQGNINDHVVSMRALEPDVIYSFGWQQIYRQQLLKLCRVIGIHESLLPRGAGAVPLANAILHELSETGCTLFWLDGGMDTGAVIGQLKMKLSPLEATSTELYEEGMDLGARLLRKFVPSVNDGTAPNIPQDLSERTTFGKINWADWSSEKVKRAKTYPYD